MHRGDLDDDRFLILRCLFQRKDELTQIFNRIYIVVRRRRNCIRALGDHTGTRNVADDLSSRQMSSDTGFCALSHFNLYRGAGV